MTGGQPTQSKARLCFTNAYKLQNLIHTLRHMAEGQAS